jgi:DNA-binding NarL/FixJ family response regulator
MLEPEFAVVDVAADGRALVKSTLQFKPDGVVLEVNLPQLNGIDAARELKQKLPKLKLIFLTANSNANVAAEAFRSGASAYLLKRSGAEEFMTAIRRVVRGESYISPVIERETIDYILRFSSHAKSDRKITTREAEILQLLTEGSSMKQVAAILGISKNTIAFHKYKMMKRLGIGSNAGLIQYAMRRYMAPPQGSWTVTDSAGTRFMEVPEGTRDLLAPLRSNGERQRQLKSAARTRPRMENRYATNIQ